jgi:hypothetical protein
MDEVEPDLNFKGKQRKYPDGFEKNRLPMDMFYATRMAMLQGSV